MKDVSETYKEDIKSKKVINRSSKGRKSKKVPLPTNREVAKKSSPVISISVYDTIMPYNQFLSLPNEERRRALNAYCEKTPKAEIARIWDRSPQVVYDLYYRLNKKVKKPSPPQDSLAVKNTGAELIPAPIKSEEIFPLEFKLVKELSGYQIQNFTLKFVDFFDMDKELQVDLDIRRSGNTLFNIHISVSATIHASEFSDQILSNVCLLPKDDKFFLTFHIRELLEKEKAESV